ncbi:MAG TPA: helix-turn-helix domain-containing protein [Bacillota bacterium]
MLFLNGLILQCVRNIKAARSVSAVYYILRGKRSIQTVHDARIFHLEHYYGTNRSLGRNVFDQRVTQLKREGLLQQSTNDAGLIVSGQGEGYLRQLLETFPFHYFHGFHYHHIASIFFDRIRLLIQTYTNSSMNHLSFIPIIDDLHITSWVKSFYIYYKNIDAQWMLQYLYDDLHAILSQLKNREAEFFIDCFTGYKQYGLSTEQLARKYHVTREDVQLLTVAITHKVLQTAHERNRRLKILPHLIRDLPMNHFITKTAETTYKLFKKGYTIEQISQIRQLKKNTICDHFVEISLFDSTFPVEDYVDQDDQREIVQATQEAKTSQLKEIKRAVSEEITYFQIRLVLAQMDRMQGEYDDER